MYDKELTNGQRSVCNDYKLAVKAGVHNDKKTAWHKGQSTSQCNVVSMNATQNDASKCIGCRADLIKNTDH